MSPHTKEPRDTGNREMPDKSEDPEYEVKRSMLEAAGLDPDSELVKQPFHVILREIQLIKAGLKSPSPPPTQATPSKEAPAPKKAKEVGQRSPAGIITASPEKQREEYGGARRRRLDEMLARILKLSDSLKETEDETVELASLLRREMAPGLEELVTEQEALVKSAGSDERTERERLNKIESLGKEILKKTERYITKPDEAKAPSKKTLVRIEALRKSSSVRQARVEKVLKDQQSIMAEIQRLNEEADQ